MAEQTAVGTTNYLREGYDDVLSNERRALLALTAQHGSDAQIEFDRQKQQADAARKTSLEAAAARGTAVNAPEALQAELTQNYDRLLAAMSDGAVASKLTHSREMDRIGAANAAYIDAIRAQSPLLQAQLDAQIAAAKESADAAARGRSGGGGGGGGGGSGSGFGGLAEEIPEPGAIEWDLSRASQDLYSAYLRDVRSGMSPDRARQNMIATAQGAMAEMDPATQAQMTASLNAAMNRANNGKMPEGSPGTPGRGYRGPGSYTPPATSTRRPGGIFRAEEANAARPSNASQQAAAAILQRPPSGTDRAVWAAALQLYQGRALERQSVKLSPDKQRQAIAMAAQMRAAATRSANRG
jgi:hypothetical protein